MASLTESTITLNAQLAECSSSAGRFSSAKFSVSLEVSVWFQHLVLAVRFDLKYDWLRCTKFALVTEVCLHHASAL